MKVLHNLKPIYDIESKILVLGSMPSVTSRDIGFYYANKTNRFFPILEKLYNVKLETIEDKEFFLHKNHIALWDTIKSCEINASDDSSIKNVIPNDITKIINESKIECIFCTGKKSYEIFNKYINSNLPCILLPSPSAANASFSLDRLVKEYEVIKKYTS